MFVVLKGSSQEHADLPGQKFVVDAGFPYRTIQEDDPKIRIIIIEPASDPTSALVCTLFETRLSDAVPYTALSYVWGDSKLDQTITVNETSVNITSSLANALTHVRGDTYATMLWADALCINQQDDADKSHQVQLMSRIYSNAKQVIAWLGPAADDSDYAIDILQRMYHGIRRNALEQAAAENREVSPLLNGKPPAHSDLIWLFELPELCVEDDPTAPFRNRALKAINLLLSRPYWERLWIRQEMVLATDLELLCGNRTIQWEFLELAVLKGIRDLKNWREARPYFSGNIWSTLAYIDTRHVHHVYIGRATKALGADIPIYAQVIRNLGLKATNARDHIFGLSSLARCDIAIDYARSVESLYTEFAMGWYKCSYEETTKPWPPLSFSGVGHKYGSDQAALNVPSWVPDLQMVGSINCRWSLCLPAYEACGNTAPNVKIDPLTNSLSLEGVSCDTIKTCWLFDDEFKSQLEPLYAQMLSLYPEFVYPTGMPILQAIFRTLLADIGHDGRLDPAGTEFFELLGAFLLDILRERIKSLRKAHDVSDAGPAFLFNINNIDSVPDPIVDQALSSLGIPSSQAFRPAFIGQYYCQEGDWPSFSQLCLRSSDLFGVLAHATLDGRSIFHTEKGYLGLGPPLARDDDILCILSSHNVPVALREVDAGKHKLVGDCFVLGLMDGEAVDATTWSGSIRQFVVI